MELATEDRPDTRRLRDEPIDLTRVERGMVWLVAIAITTLLIGVTYAVVLRT